MAGAVADGEIDLSIGEPDQALPDILVETAVRSLRTGRTGYTPKLGLPELRELVADDVATSTGHRPATDDVVITVGGTGAVAVALAAASSPATGIVVPDPAWPNYRILATRLGIPVHSYPQGGSGAGFADLARIEDGLRAGARLVVVNSPANPTGAVASGDALRSLVDLVRRHDAYLLSDEAYESIVYAGGRAPSPLSHGPDVTFCARTFSKTYSMTGLRVGALISPPRFRGDVAALHGTVAGCAPITAQVTAMEALRSLSGRGSELAAIYRERHRSAVDVLGPWAPSATTDELGGFYLWLDVRSTGHTSDEVCDALRARGVVVSSGRVYSGMDVFVRLALTAPDARLGQALRTIRAELDRLAAGPPPLDDPLYSQPKIAGTAP
ncbi:pyridoxal phosphate-dependent aminotransferase [Micromonospora zingiberis]